MTREEMLKKSGLTEAEFKELVEKFRSFHNSLNNAQRAAVDRWLPSAERIAASFGPALTKEKLAKNLGTEDAPETASAQSGVGLGAQSGVGFGTLSNPNGSDS
jgi:hypothetical protein